MKAAECDFSEVLFISVAIQMKATEQHLFPAVLFIMLHNVVVTFGITKMCKMCLFSFLINVLPLPRSHRLAISHAPLDNSPRSVVLLHSQL